MSTASKRKSKFFMFIKFSRIPYMPFSLGIDPGNICNLRCPLCPTGKSEPGAKKGFMSFRLFKQIFDQLKEDLSEINLYNWGEPLLNKDLIRMIRYVKECNKNIKVLTSTNLNVNDNALLEEFISSGIDQVVVSCDGVSQAVYEKYRVGGNLDLVMKNLKFLVNKNKLSSKNTLITWNFLVFKHNEHEIEAAKEMAKDLGVKLEVGLMRTSLKDEILRPHEKNIEIDSDWIPDNPDYSAYDKVNLCTKKKIKTCKKLWQSISVNCNGLVFPCCAVYDERFAFGDSKKDSLKDIWNNKKFVSARKEVLNKNLPATTICGICRDNGFMHM